MRRSVLDSQRNDWPPHLETDDAEVRAVMTRGDDGRMRVDRYVTPGRLLLNLGKLVDSVEAVAVALTLEQLDELVQLTRRLETVALTQVDKRESELAKEVRLGIARLQGQAIRGARARDRRSRG